MTAAARAWYEEAFRADYRRVYPHRDLAAARDEVAFLLAQGLPRPAARVLDLCCGFARHSLALAEAGLAPLGLDLSAELLAGAAPELAGKLVRADMRCLPIAAGALDGAVCLFSSFGYFCEPGADAALLLGLARVLRPGAPLFLDLMNPTRIRAQLVPRSEVRRDGYLILERRCLSPDGGRVIKEVTLKGPHGEKRAWREDVRLFEPEAIAGLLGAAGFRVEAVWGDFRGAGFDCGSERQLLRASLVS